MGVSYLSAEMQSVYTTAPADWVKLLFDESIFGTRSHL